MTKNTAENTPTQAPADRDALIEFRARVHHSHVSAGPWEDMPGGYLSNMLAAAPDLLEALKEMLVHYGDMQDGDGETPHEVHAARNAIAKAEGRTND